MSTAKSTTPPVAKPSVRYGVTIGIAVFLAALVSFYLHKDESTLMTTIRTFIISKRWTIHLFSFASWFGCSMWVNFISGIVMFKTLPRHTFGRLQAALFPRFFQYSAVCIGICILTDVMMSGLNKKSLVPLVQLFNLIAIFVTILMNLLVLEPKTTRIMYLRHKVERRLGTGHEIGQLKPSDPEKAKDPELVELTKQFGMYHGMSASLSLLGLASGIWHIFWLSGMIQMRDE